MIVAGLDVALAATGIALTTHGGAPSYLLTARSAPDDKPTLESRRRRIHLMAERILDYATEADLVVIEGPAHSRNDPGTWDRCGLWWQIVNDLIGRCIPIVAVPPNVRAMYATGNGRAKKPQVHDETRIRYPSWPVDDHDQADALVLAAMGRDHYGEPLLTLPQTHRRALASVKHWPALHPRTIIGGHPA